MITERILSPARFSHASAITGYREGVLIAFYTGDAECHSSQKVALYYSHDNGTISEPTTLEDFTGNPILYTYGRGKAAKIIYSKFEKLVPTRVHWWQHCSLWIRDVGVKDGKVVIGEPLQLMWEGEEDQPEDFLGYLPRCNPIVGPYGYLLPLYRENDPHYHGTVLHSEDGVDWKYQGTIGKGTRCIQPTLWTDKDGVVHSLLRNFFDRWAPGPKRFAFHSESKDNGHTWSDLELTKFPNCNNSILAIDCPNAERNHIGGDHRIPLFVWNNDLEGRKHLTLGTRDQQPLVVLDSYGSYPAACVHNNKLHVTYTAKANHYKAPFAKTVIKHKQFYLIPLLKEAIKYEQIAANSPTDSSRV